MSKKYDVVATTGTYQDRQSGEKKFINRNVGSIIQTQHGFRLCLDASFNPAGCKVEEDGKVWLALFEPKPKESQPSQPRSEPQGYGGGSGPMDDSEIPF